MDYTDNVKNNNIFALFWGNMDIARMKKYGKHWWY